MNSLHLRQYQATTTHHRHDYAQLVMPIDGPLEIALGGQTRLLHYGEVCIIAPGEGHDFAADPALTFLVQDSDWLPDSLHGPAIVQLDDPQRAYLHFLHALLVSGRTLSGVDSQWLSLLASQQGLSPRLRRVQQYIDAHLEKALTSRELAAIACLGLSQFNLCFRRELGMSVQQYVQQRRLAHAANLLRHTHLPVGHVAARVGYSNPAAFADAFSRQFGLPPARWRQQNGDTPA